MKIIRKNVIKFICILSFAVFVFTYNFTVKAAGNIYINDEQITDESDSVSVYVPSKGKVEIKVNGKVIGKKKYDSKGYGDISFKKQKAGVRLSVVYTSNKGVKSSVTKKIVPVSKLKVSKKISAPIVAEKNMYYNYYPKINSGTTSLYIKCDKGTTLYIQNGYGDVISKTYYPVTRTKKVAIPKQKSGTLYFYAVKSKKRSSIVKYSVSDVHKPLMPVVEQNGDKLTIKGEIGTEVYVTVINETGVNVGLIQTDKGIIYQNSKIEDNTLCWVYLRDSGGNVSHFVYHYWK